MATARVRDARHRHREFLVYVGRPWAGLEGHPLTNPFRLSRDGDSPVARVSVLEKYEAWLADHPDRDRLLSELWADTEGGRLPLACWCGDWNPGDRPLGCHAYILAVELNRRFGGVE